MWEDHKTNAAKYRSKVRVPTESKKRKAQKGPTISWSATHSQYTKNIRSVVVPVANNGGAAISCSAPPPLWSL